MLFVADRPSAVSPLPRLSLAPAQNALNSLALLNRPEQLAMRSPGARQMLASLNAQKRHHNRLLFDALGDALMPDEEWSSFPAYVEALAAREPLSLRDQLLRRLAGWVPSRADAREGVLALPQDSGPHATPEQLRRNLQTFVAHRSRRRGVAPLEPALYQEAHMLLGDPQRLHALVVTHLRALWQQCLAAEWQHLLPVLQTLLPVCAQRIAQPAASAVDMLRALTGDDVPDDVSAQLPGAPSLVFVLSGHMLHSARAVRTEHNLWLFFGLPTHPAIFRRSPVGKAELLARLRVLADETSLHVLALLTQHDELSAQEIMSQLGLSQPNASRHLNRLSTAGYVQERRQGGAAKRYRLTPAYLAQTFQALDQYLADRAFAHAPAEPARASLPGVSAELRRLVDLQGRVMHWPSKRKDQLLVLDYLAARFEADKQYTEKEVNTILQQWHLWNDPAFLRRELVDARRLSRTKNGARYWRDLSNLKR